MNATADIERADTIPPVDQQPSSPSRSLAILLCGLPAIYFVAVAVYGLVNFSSYGADLPQFLRYIAGPGLIALAFFAAGFLLSARRGANVGLTATAVLFTLLLIELFLNARVVMAMLSIVGMVGNDTVSGDEVARGRDGIPPMYSSKHLTEELEIERLDQAILGGIPGKEVLLCAHEGKPLYYTADRYGFNNEDTIHDQPLKVMLVGDSFVEGHCQPGPDTFVGKMRDLQPQTAGIGKRAAGPLLELALIGRYGAAFEPDYVVMAFFAGNDWKNLSRETSMPWLAQSMNPGVEFGDPHLSDDTIREAGEIVDQWWEEDVSPTTIFSKSSFVRNIFALNEVWGLLGLDYPRVTRDQPIYGDVLARAKQITESWGGRFVLVYIPQDARFRGFFDKSFAYDSLRSNVLDAAAREQVQVIDLTEVFGRFDDPTALYASDGHFSAQGAEVASGAVNEWIDSLQEPEQ